MTSHREAATILEEQRRQLMQLREELKKLKHKAAHVDGIEQVLEGCKAKPEGTTIGMKVPDATRERLKVQQVRWDGKSYRQMVQACMELGLRVLEKSEDAKPAVQRVQRPQGTGLRSVPSAAGV